MGDIVPIFGAMVRTARSKACDAKVVAEAMALAARKRLLLVELQQLMLDLLQRDWDPKGSDEHRTNCMAAAAELDGWLDSSVHSSVPSHVHCEWLSRSSQVKEIQELIYGSNGEQSLESRIKTAEVLISEWSRPFR